MQIPKNHDQFAAALFAYQPAEDHAAGIYAAQSHPSPVARCVETFRALKDAPDLDDEGKALLFGAAFMIGAGGGWHGLGPDASALIFGRSAEIAALESASASAPDAPAA